jgi:uridine phosphorylase
MNVRLRYLHDNPKLHLPAVEQESVKKRTMNESRTPPILLHKDYEQESVFTAENLLREARRQKALATSPAPSICLLDPDGDILDSLVAENKAVLEPAWACYHTRLYSFEQEGVRYGIVARVVGASFAVLVAEELFASGCELLISVTSAGQILPTRQPPYFILIDKALRDEGTSYHYLPPSDYSHLDAALLKLLDGVFTSAHVPVERGATWTTDAPFRETASGIVRHREAEILAVEMEAAALYAFAKAKRKDVICLAHVTNQMASIEGDFEKGTDNGSRDALTVAGIVAKAWLTGRKD